MPHDVTFSSALFLRVAWGFQPSGTISKCKERPSPNPWPEMHPKGKRWEGQRALNKQHEVIGSIIFLAGPCQRGKWKGRGRSCSCIKSRRKIQNWSLTSDPVYDVTRFMQKEFSENRNSTSAKSNKEMSLHLFLHSSICSQTHSPSVLCAPEIKYSVSDKHALLVSFMHLANIYPECPLSPH